MAFLKDKFSLVGGQARTGNAPAHWSYLSLDDSLTDVLVPGYFDELAVELSAGDFIDVFTTTGKSIITVASTTVSPTQRIVVIDSNMIGSQAGQGALLEKDDQEVANTTVTALTWTAAVYDTSEIFNLSDPTELKVPEGVTVVKVAASILWEFNVGGFRALSIFKNGTTFKGEPINEILPTPLVLNQGQEVITAMIQVVAGDIFEVIAFQNSGAPLDVLAGPQTWANMYLIR